MLEGYTPHSINIYSFNQDGFGQETRTLLKSNIKCRFVRGVEATRDYIPAYRTQENIVYKAVCYIPYSQISDITIDYGYIVEFNDCEYRVLDIYEGIDFEGNIDFIKLGLA